MKQKIDWICQLPTPYNDCLFRQLSIDPAIELTVHYIDEKLSAYPWKSKMAQGYTARTYKRLLGLDLTLVGKAVADKKSLFVVGGWHEPTVIALLILLGSLRRPFLIWTDAPNLHKRRSSLKAFLRKIFLKWVFRRATFVMGAGKLALKNLMEMGCPPEKLVNLPYVIDLDIFSAKRMDQEYSNSQMIILSSGRLVNSHKGYDLALRALATAKKKIGNFKYRIAGTGPDMDGLKTLSRELGLEANVEFVGWIEGEDLPAFYRTGNIFLHPAHFEPYGVAVVEAMASGLVVIASDQTGAAVDRIVNGENGFIFKNGSTNDLAEKILYVTTHSEVWEGVAHRARRAAESWTSTRAVAVLKQLIGLRLQTVKG